MKSEILQSTPKARSATSKGFSLVEVILASSVFALLVTALVGVFLYGQEAAALSGNRARAAMLAEEGLEAARNIRDSGFANLTNGTFGLSTTSSQWNLSGAQDISGIFTRQVVISTVDAKRKTAVANVSWQQNPQRTGLVSLTTRLTNWLASGAVGDWSTTTQESALDLSGNTDGVKIQVVGDYAYVIRNGGVNFSVINISNPALPALVGSMTLVGVPQNIYVSGNYAYVASEDNTQEFQIINVSNPAAPSLSGSLNLAGNANVLGVFMSGSSAYLTRANSGDAEFVIVSVANPAAPALVGSFDLGADGSEVVVLGNFAYVASGDNSQELKVISISNPLLPTLAGFLDLTSNTDANSIALAGSIIFIGQGSTLYTVNVAAPASPALLGTLALGGIINDIALNFGKSDAYAYLATSDTANEFKVIDATTSAAPFLLGQRNIIGSNPLLGAAYDDTLDRAFVVGQSNTEEFVIIAPK